MSSLVHFAAVDGARGKYGRQPLARGAAELARLERRRIAAAVPELNAGEAAVPMRHLAHVAQVGDVTLIPDARGSVGIFVGFGMDGAELGKHRAPAALGLHAAQMGLSAGPLGAGSGAVRGLPESIAELLGADLDGLEQHIVFGISRHVASLQGPGHAPHATAYTVRARAPYGGEVR